MINTQKKTIQIRIVKDKFLNVKYEDFCNLQDKLQNIFSKVIPEFFSSLITVYTEQELQNVIIKKREEIVQFFQKIDTTIKSSDQKHRGTVAADELMPLLCAFLHRFEEFPETKNKFALHFLRNIEIIIRLIEICLTNRNNYSEACYYVTTLLAVIKSFKEETIDDFKSVELEFKKLLKTHNNILQIQEDYAFDVSKSAFIKQRQKELEALIKDFIDGLMIGRESESLKQAENSYLKDFVERWHKKLKEMYEYSWWICYPLEFPQEKIQRKINSLNERLIAAKDKINYKKTVKQSPFFSVLLKSIQRCWIRRKIGKLSSRIKEYEERSKFWEDKAKKHLQKFQNQLKACHQNGGKLALNYDREEVGLYMSIYNYFVTLSAIIVDNKSDSKSSSDAVKEMKLLSELFAKIASCSDEEIKDEMQKYKDWVKKENFFYRVFSALGGGKIFTWVLQLISENIAKHFIFVERALLIQKLNHYLCEKKNKEEKKTVESKLELKTFSKDKKQKQTNETPLDVIDVKKKSCRRTGSCILFGFGFFFDRKKNFYSLSERVLNDLSPDTPTGHNRTITFP